MKYVNYLLSDMFLLKTTLQRGRVLSKGLFSEKLRVKN